MATRISSLPFAQIGAIVNSEGINKKTRASLIKAIAEADGVTVRTVQRRFTTATEKRGQGKNFTLKTANVVKKWFANNAVSDEKLPGTKGNLLVQETYSNQKDALDRARELEDFADDPDEDTGDLDLYPGSIYQSAKQVQTYYVPQGAKYQEGRIYESDPKDWGKQTAPAGGTWIVKVLN